MGRTEEPAGPLHGRCVLVTGAGGFIGRRVVHEYLAAGATVRAHVGPPEASDAELPDTVTRAFGWIDDADFVPELVAGVDVVAHLAGPPSVVESFAEPARYARAHVVGTAVVLDACRAADVPTFVHLSSAEVYGPTDCDAIHEQHVTNPASPYGACKLAAEHLVRAAAGAGPLAATILRPFSVYGPGLNDYGVVAACVRQALTADEIVLADLRPVRDYCYVDDVARGIVAATTGGAAGTVRTCNLASGTGTSVAALAERVVTIVGRTLPIRAADSDARPAAARDTRKIANVERARADLGWCASTSLTDGLGATIDWYREERLGASRPDRAGR